MFESTTMRTTTWTALLLAGFWMAACSGTMDDGTGGADAKPGIDESAFSGGGKGDFADRADVLDDIALDSTVEGKFDPRVRNYGYTFEAKKGAELTIELTATAGDDARGLDGGDTLDTVMAVYKGFDGPGEIGEKVAESDDGPDSVAAPPIDLEIKETGTYFLAFTSYDDTGTGHYELDLSCAGTDFQCQRPDYQKPCEEGERYVRGGKIDSDTTWNACRVVLLETATVTESTTLTIRPGVTVHGNYLSAGEDEFFGSVTLDVDGTLQAAGTEEDPVVFTALKDRGWGGIALRGSDHSIEHVIVDRANIGFDLHGTDNATIRNAVIEGTAKAGDETERGRAGIRANADSQAKFTHSLVKGYRAGVLTNNNEGLVVEDSVIRENSRGVKLEGQTTLDRNDIKYCREDVSETTHRDPVFKHVDILENSMYGIDIQGDTVMLKVENSNLINNGKAGLHLFGTQLAEDSYLNNNNIFGNNGQTDEESTPQIKTYHRNTVELEENHWGFISDPQLRNAWDLQCAEEGGDISFTGFAPEPIENAGPRTEDVREEVKQQSWEQTRQDG